MSVRNALLLFLLLACMIVLAGCSGSQPARGAAAPVPAGTNAPAPAGTAAAPAVSAPPAPSAAPVVTGTQAAPKAAGKTYSFEGDNDATGVFTTDSSRSWVFAMSCPGAQEIFMANVMDKNHDNVAELANEGAGSFTGSKTVQLPAGKYYLEVAADSPWTITVSAS